MFFVRVSKTNFIFAVSQVKVYFFKEQFGFAGAKPNCSLKPNNEKEIEVSTCM